MNFIRNKNFIKDKKHPLAWSLFYFAVFLFFFQLSVANLDPDLGWHLRVGRDILETRSVPHAETYLHPIKIKEWVDHEWLGNVFLYKIFASGDSGFWILGLIFSLIITANLMLIVFLLKKCLIPNGKSFAFIFFSVLFEVVAILVISQFFGVRLQVISWLFLSLLLFIFYLFMEKREVKYLFALPLFFAIWSNLHGSFVMGLFVYFVFAVFCFFKLNDMRNKEKIIILSAGIFSFLATILNPYGTRLWELIFLDYTTTNYYTKHIVEWLPLYAQTSSAAFFPENLYSTLYCALFIGVIILSLVFKVFSGKEKFWNFLFLMSIFFLLLSIEQRRHVPIFVFYSCPIIIAFFCRIFPKFKLERTPFLICARSIIMLLYASFILLFLTIILPLAKLDPFERKGWLSPVECVNFLKNHEKLGSLNILNSYNWGGYLNWVWPEKKIFIDGRFPQMKIEGNKTFLEEYNEFIAEGKSQKQLEKHGLELVLWQKQKAEKVSKIEKYIQEKISPNKTTKQPGKDAHFIHYLEENWKKQYEDDLCVIYSKPGISGT